MWEKGALVFYKIVSCPDCTPHEEEKGSGYNTTSRSTLEGRNQMRTLCGISLPPSSKQRTISTSVEVPSSFYKPALLLTREL